MRGVDKLGDPAIELISTPMPHAVRSYATEQPNFMTTAGMRAASHIV